MKKNLLMIGCFVALLASFAVAQPPFQAGGKLYTSFFAGGHNTRPCPWWATDSLSTRFGEFPYYIIWDDLNDTTKAKIHISWYVPHVMNPTTPWWGDSLKWGQVRPYFRGLFTSIETGDTLIRSLPVGSPNEVVSRDDEGNYNYSAKFNNDLLPIPNDGSAWKMEIVPTINIYDSVAVNPNSSQESPRVVVRMNAETPLDSLLWFRSTWDDNQENYQLHREMLRNFPYFQSSLSLMFNHYYDEENCDSVQHYGNRYIESLTNNLDEFNSEISYPAPEIGLDSVHVNTVKEMIDDICVDGRAQRLKYPLRIIE
jgi:hypothetical protein